MNIWFAAAVLTSAATFLIHTFVGGRMVARPLLAAEGLGKVSKYTNYYCWHMVTIVLAAQTLAFAITAQNPSERILAMFASGGALAFMVWGLAMIAIFKLRMTNYPQWLLFLPTALLGMAGLYL